MSEHELWNELGNLYFLSGAYDSAIHAYSKAIEINRQFGRPYSNMALVCVQKGQYERAIEWARYSLDLLSDPREKAVSWNRLGNIYRQRKDYYMAITAYQKADEIYPPSRDRQDLQGRDADIPLMINVLPPDPSIAARVMEPYPGDAQPEMPPAETRPDDAPEESVNGMVEMPAETIHAREEVTPLSLDLFRSVRQETMKPDESVLDASPEVFGQIALGEFPGPAKVEAEIQPGVEMEEEDSQDLPASLQKTVEDAMLTLLLTSPPARVEEDQDSELAELISLARQDSSRGEVDTPLLPAEAQEPVCVSVDLQTPLVTGGAEENSLSGTNRPARKNAAENPVIGDLKIILERNPQDPVAWDALGNFYKSSGLYQEAISAYEQAIFIEPRNPSFNYHLGLVYAAAERHDDALRLFRKVIELDPNDGLAHATLSGCYRRLGLDELARHHVEKAILLNNTFQDENEYNRACLESLCGNTDRALEYLDRALQSNPSYAAWALNDPDLDFVRRDSRFATLISRHPSGLNIDNESLYLSMESDVTV